MNEFEILLNNFNDHQLNYTPLNTLKINYNKEKNKYKQYFILLGDKNILEDLFKIHDELVKMHNIKSTKANEIQTALNDYLQNAINDNTDEIKLNPILTENNYVDDNYANAYYLNNTINSIGTGDIDNDFENYETNTIGLYDRTYNYDVAPFNITDFNSSLLLTQRILLNRNLSILNNYITLSYNPNITMSFILTHPEMQWNWRALSSHNNITFDDIIKNMQLSWNWKEISVNNPNIKTMHIINNKHLPWDWYQLTRDQRITLNFIDENPNLNWDWHDGILTRSDINMRFINNHFIKIAYDMSNEFVLRVNQKIAIQSNNNISFKDMTDNLQINWVWSSFSNNAKLPFEFVKRHLNYNWNWKLISANPNLKDGDVENNFELSWDTHQLAQNNSISIQFVLNHQELNWTPYSWHYISQKPSITINIILNNRDKPWDKDMLSQNQSISLSDIYKNPIIGWNWGCVFKRTDISVFNKINLFNYWQEWYKYARTLNPLNSLGNYDKKPIQFLDDPKIALDTIKNNPHIIWNYEILSKNPNINYQYVKDNIVKNWDWFELSRNLNISLKDITDNPHHIWHYKIIVKRPDINIKFIKDNIHYIDASVLKCINKNYIYEDDAFEYHYKKYKKRINRLLINRTNLLYLQIDEMLSYL